MTPTSYKWKPIEDLKDPGSLSDGELGPLLKVWKDQRPALPDEAVQKFNERLAREWAIETGAIEGAYTLGRGVTEALISEGIKASSIPPKVNMDREELVAILNDHLEALDGLFAFVKGERDLSTSYIKELHTVLMRHHDTHTVRDQFGKKYAKELQKGVYKTLPNNPLRPEGDVHEFCPPEQTASEMDRLIELYHGHNGKNIPPEVEAAWLHHAFTQIHPFADANGRVARALASLVFIKSGGFPFVVRSVDRGKYINKNGYIAALEVADAGDLRPLTRFFVQAQRWALLGALQALPLGDGPAKADPPATPEEVIAGVRGLIDRGRADKALPKRWDATDRIASVLSAMAKNRLEEIAGALRASGVDVSVEPSPPEYPVITLLAQQYDYSNANAEGYHTILVRLHTGPMSRIVFSLHPVGFHYRGVMGVLLYFGSPAGTAVSATDDMFQFNYKDDSAEVEKRFSKWFEQGLTRALTMWRDTL